ncbi:hypothetical protein AHAS_Ahas01G0037900 [Arachis hypogaea]
MQYEESKKGEEDFFGTSSLVPRVEEWMQEETGDATIFYANIVRGSSRERPMEPPESEEEDPISEDKEIPKSKNKETNRQQKNTQKSDVVMEDLGEDDLDHALLDSSCKIYDYHLVIRLWKPNFNSLVTTIGNITAWIKLPGLPIELYNEKILRKIGDLVGRICKIGYNNPTVQGSNNKDIQNKISQITGENKSSSTQETGMIATNRTRINRKQKEVQHKDNWIETDDVTQSTSNMETENEGTIAINPNEGNPLNPMDKVMEMSDQSR